MEAHAKLLYRDDSQIIVACPYCFGSHRHGDGGNVDVSGNYYSSHCHQGSYRVYGVYDFKTADIALRRREADLRRKRAAKPPKCDACRDTGRAYASDGVYMQCLMCSAGNG